MNGSIPLIGLSCGLHPRGPDGEVFHASAAMAYVRALERLGALVVMIPPLKQNMELIRRFDGLILTGGTDIEPSLYGQKRTAPLMEPDRSRDEYEISLAQSTFEMDIPVLGICRGIQIINVALGGTLWQDIATQVAKSFSHSGFPEDLDAFKNHPVRLAKDSKLSEAFNGSREINVNSAHHQAVQDLGSNLQATAYAPDGLIEAIESIAHEWVVGVQWHPERQEKFDTNREAIFNAFVAATSKKRNIA